MKYYKVLFDGNVAIDASLLDDGFPDEIVHILNVDGIRVIEWLVVLADNEADAVREASTIIKQYRAFFGL